MARHVILYRTASGVEPFAEYVDSLKDRAGASRIQTRVTRARLGNLGAHRGVGEGVVELKIDFGPGYRVYIGLHGETSVILLCAGDKSSQDGDISMALEYWRAYKRNA
ncbi:MAG: type II toxin-antitoxin system RelE/ParE family toxin [Elusimicrobiota bacterium]